MTDAPPVVDPSARAVAATGQPGETANVAAVSELAKRVIGNVEHAIVGKRKQLVLSLVAWFSGGHVLLEDVPGVAKTMLARALAKSVGCQFKRVQCTPDLLPTDVQALGADFLVFSGHKIYAPTGIGVLWGRMELLNELPPWQGGGEMIKEVTFEATTYNDPPFKYEAGTPNIEGAIALAAAFDYVNDIGIDAIHEHEGELIRAAADALADIPGIRFYGPADRSGSLSFNIEGVHHYDLGTLLDQMGVAVRTGHHCCQPLMARFGITGTVRASFALYNTQKDVEALAAATKKAVGMLR